jgi:hypothetical protein
VDAESIELARRVVALLRDVLTSGAIQSSPLLSVTEGSATSRATHGLAIHLLQRCVDPADLEHELPSMDSVLADRLANTLLDGIDWDGIDWS